MEGRGMNHFHAWLARMKHIIRWGLMRNTTVENIQEHSLQVAIIAHSLALIKNRYFGGNLNSERICLLAVFHESHEVITGDLPTPVKYFNPEIKNAYKEIENIANTKLLGMLPDELKQDYKPLLFKSDGEKENWDIVKAADKICAYLKCVEEKKSGNREFSHAEKTILKDISSLNMSEVSYFMKEFVPSYSLTLDEMG
jgi:5'-deoxynucleotidase